MPTRKLNVFLCHAKEDKPTVRELYRQLTAEGWMDVWLDEENLFPGQEWDLEIEKAVEQADVVIVCLSSHSVDKEGYVQKELRFVLNIADEKPEGTIFVVPVRLDECQVPRRIRAWQYVDYFPKANQKRAYARLLESLKLRAGNIESTTGNQIHPSVKATVDEIASLKRKPIPFEVLRRMAAYQAVVGQIDKKGDVYDNTEYRKSIERTLVEAKKQNKWIFNPTAIFVKLPKSIKRFLAVLGILILTSVCFTFGSDYIFNKIFTFVTITPTVTYPPTQASKVASTFTSVPATLSPTVVPTYTSTPKTEITLGVGSTWISPKDGATMLFIPGGEFSMGGNRRAEEWPIHTLFIDSYWMDKTEVTNEMYAKCVKEKKCNPPRFSRSYSRESYYGGSKFDNYPVIYIEWNDANLYCEWRGDGARLPTEAEWEKAAGWDDEKKEKRIFPWGNSFNGALLNFLR